MLCELCMKDVDWTIKVNQHLRDKPMTYVMTREICLVCFAKLDWGLIPQKIIVENPYLTKEYKENLKKLKEEKEDV